VAGILEGLASRKEVVYAAIIPSFSP